MWSLHKDGSSLETCACGEAGQTTRAGDLSDFVNVLSDSRDRDTFVGYGTSVWTAIEDIAGDNSFWMRSFGEDTVSDSKERDIFAGYGTSVWTAIEDVAEDDSFWMSSFGGDNGVEGESPRGCFLSRDSFADNSSGGSFAISSFEMGSR